MDVSRKGRVCILSDYWNSKPPAPLYIRPLPQEVWEQLNMDYLGPFSNGHYMFVIIDQRSKFPEVEFLTSPWSAEQQVYK